MNWQDDPEIQQKLRERRVRNGILRSAIIWTPFFVVALAALLFFGFDQLTGGDRGSWFLVVVLLIFTVLFGSQSIQSLVDLIGQPRTARGEITRRWARNDMILMKTHYVRVGKHILRGDIDILADVTTGDEVEVRFYAHSAVIVHVEKVDAPAQPGA
jgi:hypothetical protein